MRLLNVRGRRTLTPAMGELGVIIRKQRKLKKLSLRAVGEAAGISFVAVRDIERGHVLHPTRSTLQGLADALDLPLALLALATYGAAGSPRTPTAAS